MFNAVRYKELNKAWSSELKVNMGEQKTGQTPVFVRNATGLVRSWSWLDGMFFVIINLPVGLWAVLSISLSESAFPGANQWLAVALCGLFLIPQCIVYSVLSATMPRTGGEYVFQSRILHQIFGFVVMGSILIINAWFYVFVGPTVAATGFTPLFASLYASTHNSIFLGASQFFGSTIGGLSLGLSILAWGWISLSAIASTTDKIRFGPLVSPIGFRNPCLMAKMTRTLHSYSSGRMVLGLGIGSDKTEHLAHGFPFPKIETRLEQFQEVTTIIRELVDGNHVNIDGKYFSIRSDAVRRKPKHDRIHIIVGGTHNRILDAARSSADEWNFFVPSVSLQSYLSKKEYLQSRGSNKRILISLVNPFVIGENQKSQAIHESKRPQIRS